MKRKLVFTLILLTILLVPLVIATADVKEYKAEVNNDTKKINTDYLSSSIIKISEPIIEEKEEEPKEEPKEQPKEEPKTEQKKQTETVTPVVEEVQTPVVENNPVVEEQKKPTDVLATMTGRMSNYGPDCDGCGGWIYGGRIYAKGTDARYYDSTYGTVRIVAGDRSLSFGTIVRISNTRVQSTSFIAIVLDRGGIGIGYRYLFDLLFPTEEEATRVGSSNNATFEILRYGF